MAGYHKYVFDSDRRTFVGNFDEMYEREETEGFDSWQERDLRELRKTISYTILEPYNFSRILEFGCGKGTFTHLLKKRNNEVVALDGSANAIAKARQSFPDIDFRRADLSEIVTMGERGERFDLVVIMCTLAYVESWRDVIRSIARIGRWFYVAEYIPPNPIGFVKSASDLIAEVNSSFKIHTKVQLNDEHCMLLAENLDSSP